MKKYYVMDTENAYCSIENYCCCTDDINKYIASHKIDFATNIRMVTKEEYSKARKTGHVVTYKC